MANNFRIIYLYIVCLITLTMIIGGIVSTVNNITSYFYPDSYLFFEEDNGYVTLVNATMASGEITETSKHTGMWAWKHYHKDSDTTTYQKLEGSVEFDDVDFGYTDEKIVLHNVVMYAKPGQKIAFVGSTGAGKTTITNLINRFYDIQDGKIRYDGINVNKIKKADLRRSLGIVLQDTHLFTATVMENIRFGKLDATDEEVIEAAKLANAHDFISVRDKDSSLLLPELL